MHFAYIILAHKEPMQVASLVNALLHPSDHFFIHIDAKNDLQPFEKVVIEETNNSRNIHFIETRENGQWGGFGIVQATLNAIRKITETEVEFCHVHLLSGQDFPIKPMNEIRDYFSEHPSKDFISFETFPVSHIPGGGWNRIKNYSWTIGGKRLTYVPSENSPSFSLKGKIINSLLWSTECFLPKRKLPKEMKPFYGSQWWSITGKTAKDIIKWLSDNPEYLKFHRYSLLPDEMFFQTLIWNLDKEKTPVNDNKRFILWEEGSSHPIILGSEHLERIKNSDAFFARKFEAKSRILQKLTAKE